MDIEEHTQIVGAVLRKTCAEKNITMKEIAEELGVAPNTVWRWFNGWPMSFDKAVLICLYLDISTDLLAFGKIPEIYQRAEQLTIELERERLRTKALVKRLRKKDIV